MATLADALRGHRAIGIDTNCFVYYLEGGLWARELKDAVFVPLERGAFRGVTSVLTLAEILARPKSLGRDDVCEQYTALLCSYPNLEVLPVTLDIAIRCADIRASHRIRTPDALQLATAWESGATAFLTNDAGLPRKVRPVDVLLLGRFLPRPAADGTAEEPRSHS